VTAQFRPLVIPPGVVSHATKKMGSANYAEVNMVRWQNDQLMPIGGQTKYNFEFASKCKAVHGFFDLGQTYHIAYLCEANIYIDTGGALLDITPLDMRAPTPPTEGGYGDGLYSPGDPLNPDPVDDPDELYGTPRLLGSDAAIDRLPDAYSLSNFGAELLAMTSADGRLLYWNPADPPGTLAQEVQPKAGSVVPHGRCFVVTGERFVQIFGSYLDGTEDGVSGGGFRRFAWCEQEDFTNWSYEDLTTQAGFDDIEPSSPIICAISTRTGTLFWTGKKCYRSRYLGAPYIYNYEELADNCTPWSSQSMVNTSSMALWMSQQGPYSYDGTSVLPVQCAVRAWIDKDIDLLQVRQEACAVHVANFNEFWWCYPQNGMSGNTRAAIFNYRDGWWSQARIQRSAGVTASYTAHTIMANDRVSYEHENGFIYNDCDLPWVETFDLYLDAGFHLTTVKQLIPDIEGAISNVAYSLFYRNSRSLGLAEQRTAPKIVRPDGYVDFRTTGRDIRLRIDLATPAGFIIDKLSNLQSDGSVRPVTVGQHLIDSAPRGDR
jgi:hypothetical protein